MTEDQFERLSGLIKWVHDDLSAEMDKRFGEVSEEFGKVDARFEGVDARFEAMEKRFDKRFDKLETDNKYVLDILREVRDDLDVLKEKVASQSGYSKEIDYALARIAVIEKHLGITSAAI